MTDSTGRFPREYQNPFVENFLLLQRILRHFPDRTNLAIKYRIFSVCAPQYVMRPPVTEHVPT